MSSIIDWVILTHLFYGVGASIPGRSSILGAPEVLPREIVPQTHYEITYIYTTNEWWI